MPVSHRRVAIIKTHDFDFYKISLVRARFIGGFGEIYWIETDELLQENPFYGDVEQGMVQHMNEDHVNALVKYCRDANVALSDNDTPVMTSIDTLGFQLRIDERLQRFYFDKPVQTPVQVREALVAMARSVA